MAVDLEAKKLYLYEVARLCERLVRCTTHECLKRFLAFRLVLAGMAYEELIQIRQFPRFRKIRDVFLAHGQDGDFIRGFNAANDIRASTVRQLMEFMEAHLQLPARTTFPDRIDEVASPILSRFEHDFYSGVRISNNFLCACTGQIKEMSSGPLASAGYRFVSSRELAILSNYFLSNLHNEPSLMDLQRLFKSYYILSVVNMYDAIFRDVDNQHAIDGLREVMSADAIGNGNSLDAFRTDAVSGKAYRDLRGIRNRAIGHLDRSKNLSTILYELDAFDMAKAYSLENALFAAVEAAAMSHMAIRARFLLNTTPVGGVMIASEAGLQNAPYDDL